jgi:hypothetical protein
MLTPSEIGAARSVIVDHLQNRGRITLAYAIRLFNRQLSTSNLPPHLKKATPHAWQKPRAGILTLSTFEKWRAKFKERGHFEPLVRQKDYTVKPWHELAERMKRRSPKAKYTDIHKRLVKRHPAVSIYQLRRFFRRIDEVAGK